MRRYSWMLSILLLAALLLSAVQPLSSQATSPEMKAHTPREDVPTFGVRGPYAVGVRDFAIEPEEEGGRMIPVSVWYPALNPDAHREDETYMLNFENPDFPDFPIAGSALRDAQMDDSGGPYPLVIYSHGYWLFRQVSAYLMEQLASHGFIVIAGDHMDNWGSIFSEAQVEDYVIRPHEVADMIDFAETLSGKDGEFPGLIDLEHIGVTGHSFGADTALLVGGARLNTDVFLDEWCAMNPGDPEDLLNDCAAMPAKLDEMASLAGLDAVPQGMWPDWSDPRVDAIVPLAPGAQYFGRDGLGAVKVPIMLFESGLDWAQAAASEYYEPYTALPAEMKTHVVFDRGDHGVFLNECKAMPALIEMGFGWFCRDAVWDMNRAHDLINHFVTAFMLAELKDDADAAAALAPASAEFPGVTYRTEMYGDRTTPDEEETVIEFEAIDVACPEGGVVLSDEPMIAGRSEVEAIQEPDESSFLVDSTFFPSAYPDATWDTPGEGVDLTDGGFVVLHRGHGTGAFEGSTIEFFATLAEEQMDLPCEPVGPVAKLQGTIVRAPASAAMGSTLDPALATEIDTYVEEMMETTGLPGFALGVVKDGEIVYAKGFGVADTESGEPVTPQTVFQLAEVTMAPTTLAMLQLAEAGKIDLDEPITEYLPYFEMAGEGYKDITVRHLLLNTSGIPDSGDAAADWTEVTPEFDDGAVERLVRGLADTELLFAPGEGFEWSDIGYQILGDVVAKATGQPYEVFMQESLLTPLGMEHSTFLLDDVDPALLASPHIEDENGVVTVADVVPYSRQYAAANNLYSNLEDMARFAQVNLNRGELEGAVILPEPYFDELWTAYNETPFGDFLLGSVYPAAMFAADGLGWFVGELEDHLVVHAYGGERGYQSDIMLAPDRGLAVIAMGNGMGGDAIYTADTATDIMGMLFGAEE